MNWKPKKDRLVLEINILKGVNFLDTGALLREFHTGREFINGFCVFCSGHNHNSNRCAKVTDPSARKQIIFQKNLCYICMSPKHKASKCNANYICRKCNGRHHISICQKGSLKSTAGNNSGPIIIQQMYNQRCQQRTSTKHKHFPTVINRIKMIKL